MKFLILILSLFLITGCEKKYDEYEMPEEVNIKINEMQEYDIYSEFNLYELFGDNNVEIITKDKKIQTNDIGKFKETIEYKYNDRKYKFDVEYNVVDKVAPVYISASTYRTVKVNDDVYLCDSIVFGDNYDKTPTCEIEGEYDLTKTGVYDLKYIIKDSSNNENSKSFKLNVVNSISTNNNTNTNTPKLYLNDLLAKYKNDKTMIGIDVSRWQETIDFQKVKDAGIEFVIMRMGINSDIDKDISVDTYYRENIKNAKAAGLKVGIYVYSSAIDKKTAIEHAKWTLEELNGEELDFPIAYDWENWSKFRKYEISIHDLNDTFEAFAETLKNGGYDAMLYSSKFYLENIWTNKNNYPVWLAHYTAETDYKGDYFMWQRCNIGRVNGINGAVDIDILYKEKTSLFN